MPDGLDHLVPRAHPDNNLLLDSWLEAPLLLAIKIGVMALVSVDSTARN